MNDRLYPLGLALGGGGARGFAHLGVLQAMQEAGIRPDILSGTSVGALVGAAVAAGRTPAECMEFLKDKKILDFVRPAMSRKGFMTLNNLEEKLGAFLGVRTFGELQTPLVVTAGDMHAARPVHFERGELLPCVIASCSIPVAFVPKEIGGTEYVDGGVFMNLPVRPIRPRCKRVIAVEINSVDISEPITNMVGMAVRAFHLGLARNTDIDRAMADLFISPECMTQYSVLSLEHAEKIFTAGYNSAKQMLPQLPT